MAKTENNVLEINPRAIRIAPPTDFRVTARTMGSKLQFDIPVANVSRSGLLFQWINQKFSLPFIENTLIEMEMTSNLRGQTKYISCFGKVVRKSMTTGLDQYGIRVIHTDDSDHAEWINLISSFERLKLTESA